VSFAEVDWLFEVIRVFEVGCPNHVVHMKFIDCMRFANCMNFSSRL
jgi:hypothetical protein